MLLYPQINVITPRQQTEENDMIKSIDAEKAFDKSTPIYDKSSPESGHRGNIPQNNKGYI